MDMGKKYGDINNYIKNELNGDSGKLIHDIMEAEKLYKMEKTHNKKCYVCRVLEILKNINNRFRNL